MISSYEQLYELCEIELPGLDRPLLLQYLQQTGREWCRFTESWTEDISYNIVDSEAAGDTAYDAAIALGYSAAAAQIADDAAVDSALQYTLKPHYDAEIIRPRNVWTGGDVTETPVDTSLYRYTPSTSTLTFNSQPKTYSPVATAWVTLTAYALGDYVTSSSLRYICSIAHTSDTFATELAAYKWKLMPNDLIVRAVLIPRLYCCELAGWFMEKWAEAIIAGTKATLMGMRNKSWSQPERVIEFRMEYQRFLNIALRERNVEDKSQGAKFVTPAWVT